MNRHYLLAFLVLVVVLFLIRRGAGQIPPASRSAQWEYKVVLEGELSRREESRITPTASRIETRMNRLGAAGWELVEISGQNFYIFRRALAAVREAR